MKKLLKFLILLACVFVASSLKLDAGKKRKAGSSEEPPSKRIKLEKDPSEPIYILTERGVGYRFVDYNRP